MREDGSIESFEMDLDDFAKKIEVNTLLVVKKLTFDLVNEIINRTPVDTGWLRNNWMVSVGNPSAKIKTGKNKRFSAVEATRDVSNMQKLQPVWITNNLPYASVVEYGRYPNPPKHGSRVKGRRGKKGGYTIKTIGGYSKQAPVGMVRVSLAVIESKMAAIVSNIERGSRK